MRELAQRCAVDYTYIQKIETGKQRGSVEILIKLSKALGLDPKKVLQETFVLNGDYTTGSDPEMDLETEVFRKLDPRVRKALLDLAPVIKKTLQDGQ